MNEMNERNEVDALDCGLVANPKEHSPRRREWGW